MSNKNREITFYSLLDKMTLRHIEGLADTVPQEEFINLGWERKHFLHLWISANNDAYADSILSINTIAKLHSNLSEQLDRYCIEKGSPSKTPKEDWLNHTKMVFEDKYHEHKKAIFNKVVEWCDNQLSVLDKNSVKNKKDSIINTYDRQFEKMKSNVNIYISIYQEMLYQHIVIFNPLAINDYNEILLDCLLSYTYEYNEAFQDEWKSKLLEYSDSNRKITQYIRNIYLNGFLKIKYNSDTFVSKIDTKSISRWIQ